jgi:hypothetical protein
MTSILTVSELKGAALGPSFVCRESATTTLVSGAYRSLTWTEELDTNNAVSSGVFTVPSDQAGVYIFHYGVTVNAIGASTYIITSLEVNGSNDNQHEVYNPTIITNQAVRSSSVATLSAGDTVEFKVYQNSGSDKDTGFAQSRKAFFTGFRIGE